MLLAVVLAGLALAGCAGYGGDTVESAEGGKIRTDQGHCQLTLPRGWTWRPASWAAISPLGTEMAFQESQHSRPGMPSWEEEKAIAMADAIARGATVTEEPDRLRMDFGPHGGLSVLQRFDRFACQVTFSYRPGVREQELPVWEQIIASLERVSPTE